MVQPELRRSTTTTRLMAACLVVSAMFSTPGCVTGRTWGSNRAFGPYSRCELGDDPPLARVVAAVNDNAARMSSWDCPQARLRPHGLAAVGGSFSTTISAAAPNYLRLKASGPTGPMLDLGSNEDHFWFWGRLDEDNSIKMCSHSQSEIAQRALPVPVEPKWLMEVLGVLPLDDPDMTMEAVPQSQSRWLGKGTPQVNLVSYYSTRNGVRVKKVVVVDACHGVVLRHELQVGDRCIARAELSGHQKSRESGAIYPTQIDLTWPTRNVGLSLTMQHVRIKPSIDDAMWEMPQKTGFPVVDLGERFGRPQYRPGRESTPLEPRESRFAEVAEEEFDDDPITEPASVSGDDSDFDNLFEVDEPEPVRSRGRSTPLKSAPESRRRRPNSFGE
jgi:hypothetical protein